MPRKPRIHYTETDKALMWDRWRKGDSLETIARLFDRSHSSVASIHRWWPRVLKVQHCHSPVLRFCKY